MANFTTEYFTQKWTEHCASAPFSAPFGQFESAETAVRIAVASANWPAMRANRIEIRDHARGRTVVLDRIDNAETFETVATIDDAR